MRCVRCVADNVEGEVSWWQPLLAETKRRPDRDNDAHKTNVSKFSSRFSEEAPASGCGANFKGEETPCDKQGSIG